MPVYTCDCGAGCCAGKDAGGPATVITCGDGCGNDETWCRGVLEGWAKELGTLWATGGPRGCAISCESTCRICGGGWCTNCALGPVVAYNQTSTV